MKENIFCKYFGHHWITNDFAYSIKANGENYKYTQKRRCARCRKTEYLFDEWKPAEDVPEEEKDQGFLRQNSGNQIAE